jgi:hypothetical protein
VPFGQPVPIGDMDRESLLKNPEKSRCLRRVLIGTLQRSDGLALMGDVLLPAMEKAFGVSKKLFQGGAVHGDRVAARSTLGGFSALAST